MMSVLPEPPSTCPSTCRLSIHIHPLSVSQHWTFPSGELVKDQGIRKRTLELMSHVILRFCNYCFLRLLTLLWPLQFYFPKSTAQHSSADSKYKKRAGLTCLLMQYTCNILLILSAQSLACSCLWSGDVNCWCEVSWEDWTVEGDMAEDSQVLGEKKVQRGSALKLMILDRATLELSAASSSWRSGKLMVAPSPSLTQCTRHSIVHHIPVQCWGFWETPCTGFHTKLFSFEKCIGM